MAIDAVLESEFRTSERRRVGVPTHSAVGVDLVIVTFAVFVGWQTRVVLDIFGEEHLLQQVTTAKVLPLIALWMLALTLLGAHSPTTFGVGVGEYKRVIIGSMLAAGLIGGFCYITEFPLSRGLFLVAFLVGIPLLLVGRYLLRRVFHQLRSEGLLARRVLLTGTTTQIDEVASVLAREKWLGFSVVGAVATDSATATNRETTAGGVRLLGARHETDTIVRNAEIDVVLFVGGAVQSAQEMRKTAWALETTGADIMVLPSLTDVASDRVRVRPAAGLPFVEVEGPRAQRASRFFKRFFDVVGSLALIAFAAPVLLAVALAVRIHDGGPALFRQKRVGRNGEEFSCLKFRSMVVDADQMIDAVAAHNRHDADHVLFKATNDPRVTAPGRVIRRFSLDELPQLFNVLRGDMSLVGPRPPLPREVARYDDMAIRRLAVRPGMTGLWQVSGRSDLSWEESLRLDLYYVDNWSMGQDLRILARTANAVFSQRGAY